MRFRQTWLVEMRVDGQVSGEVDLTPDLFLDSTGQARLC